jgi:hypothetical protein|tara:strand:- start:2918 stop:3124 length:207 start_codon:yes stop_codon:yes gene_type:complete
MNKFTNIIVNLYLLLIYYVGTVCIKLKIIMRKLNDWFEINLGWLFVNGRKQEQWTEYINTKKLKHECT